MKNHLALPILSALFCPGVAAGFVPSDTVAYVVHGLDRTVAGVEVPAGPVHPNLAAVGQFPSEMAVRGSRAYVPCGGSDAIHVLDLAACSPADTIETGPGTNPYGLAFVSDTRAYATLLLTNEVVEIDLPSGNIVDAIPVGRAPQGLIFAAGRLFVANTGFDFNTFSYDPGTVSVIDPALGAVTHTLSVGLNPQNLDLAPNGEVHVVCTGDYFSVFGRAFVIDPAAPAVLDSLGIGGSPGFIAVNAAGQVYLSDYFLGLLKYDGPTRVVLRDASNPIAVGTGAAGIDFDGSGRPYVCLFEDDSLVRLDGNDLIESVFNLGNGPQDVVLYAPESPVAVTLAFFTAALEGRDVRLKWSLTGETADQYQFSLMRARSPSGPWTLVSRGRISPAPPGEQQFLDAGAFDWAAGASRLFYRLEAMSRSGLLERFGPFAIEAAAPSVEPLPPSPNPGRADHVSLQFTTSSPGEARVSVFDVLGREVARPFDGFLPTGAHNVSWDRSSIPQGVYLVKLVTPFAARTARIVLAR